MTGPLISLPLTSWFYDPVSGKAVTKNDGLSADTVQLGDGSTVASFPSLLGSGRRGMSFANGTSWLDLGLTDRFERTDPFSLYLFSFGGPVSIDTVDQALSYQGIELFLNTNYIRARLTNTLNTNQCSKQTANGSVDANAIASVAMTYDGLSSAAGLNIYYNGVVLPSSVTVDNLNATIKNGKSMLACARHNGAGVTILGTGKMTAARVYPYALTPTEIRALGDRDRALLNLF